MSTRTRRPRIRQPKIRDLKRRLLEKCAFTRDTLQFKKVATPEELSSYWPGGAENLDLSIEGWIFCYANYTRFCDRLGDDGASSASAGSTADSDVLKALGDAPVSVELESVNGEPSMHVAVYPKSFSALERIDLHDQAIGWLVEQRKKLLDLPLPVAGDALEVVGPEIIRQYQTIAWAVTHPEPGLPFDLTDTAGEMPAWLSTLSTVDLLRIHKAFVESNIQRLHALYGLLQVKTGGEETARPTWRTFFAMRSEESKVPTEILMRDRSVGSQVATALIAADVRQQALDESRRNPE